MRQRSSRKALRIRLFRCEAVGANIKNNANRGVILRLVPRLFASTPRFSLPSLSFGSG